MTQLNLWQKIEFIEELYCQIIDLQKQIELLQDELEKLKLLKIESLANFEAKTKLDLRQKKQREDFVKELLKKQIEEKETFNNIIKQIDTAIDDRLSDPEQYTKLNVNSDNPKEIEVIKRVLRQKLLSKTIF